MHLLGSFWGVELGGKGLAAGSSRGEPSKCMFQNSACAGVLPSKADFENMHLLGNFWVELGSKLPAKIETITLMRPIHGNL